MKFNNGWSPKSLVSGKTLFVLPAALPNKIHDKGLTLVNIFNKAKLIMFLDVSTQIRPV